MLNHALIGGCSLSEDICVIERLWWRLFDKLQPLSDVSKAVGGRSMDWRAQEVGGLSCETSGLVRLALVVLRFCKMITRLC